MGWYPRKVGPWQTGTYKQRIIRYVLKLLLDRIPKNIMRSTLNFIHFLFLIPVPNPDPAPISIPEIDLVPKSLIRDSYIPDPDCNSLNLSISSVIYFFLFILFTEAWRLQFPSKGEFITEMRLQIKASHKREEKKK